MLAAVARLGRDTETLPESLGGEYADVVRQLFRLETARLAFAQTLGASGFACFERMRNPLRDGYRLLMDGDDGDRCNPALYEDERGLHGRDDGRVHADAEQVRAGKPLDGALFEQYHGHAVAGGTGRERPAPACQLSGWRGGVLRRGFWRRRAERHAP